MLAETPTRWRTTGRPALRREIRASGLPFQVQEFALWLTHNLDPRGRVDVAEVLRLSPRPRRSVFWCLRQLEDTGLIKRYGSARKTGPGTWQRMSTIEAAEFAPQGADLRKPDHTPSDLQKCNQRHFPLEHKRSTSSGSVGDLTTCSKSDQDQTRTDRDAVDNDWWHLARSRTDVAHLRPGYGANTRDPAERARLGLKPLVTA